MPELKVLLVDDHPVVRAGLRTLLTESDDVVVVAEAADGQEAIDVVDQRRTTGEQLDVVLMDLQMPAGLDGVSAIEVIKQAVPHLPILVITTYDTEADIMAAIEAGASGYMLKDAPPADILRAVRDAAAGQTALGPSIAARLVERLQAPTTALSGREVEILKLLKTGLSNRAMSKQLFISEATVKTHLVHIYQKLDVENRVAAVSVATSRGLI